MTSAFPQFMVSTAQLAHLLALTDRQVRNLAAAGVLRRAGVGRKQFDAFDCVPRYLRHSRQGGGSSADIAEARLRLIEAQRREIEQRTRRADKQLIEIDLVASGFAAAMVTVGSQLDGLAGRMAGELAGINDPAVMKARLFDECRRIRNAAADQLEALASDQAGREGAESTATEESGRVG